MRLIFVRHGVTEYNHLGRYQGHSDQPLSDKGRWEAEMAARHLEMIPIDAVYASDLSRALETAEIIAQRHRKTVQLVPDLRELDFGLWEGLTSAEIVQRFGGKSFETWMKDPEKAEIEGGESIADFSARIMRGYQYVAARHSSGNIVVVTHGGVLMVLSCLLTGTPVSKMRDYFVFNAAFSIVRLENGQAQFEAVNFRDHLTADPSDCDSPVYDI